MAVYNDNSASGWIRTKNRGFLLLERWTSAHHRREIASVSCMLAVLDTWRFWLQRKLFEKLLFFLLFCCQRLQSDVQYIGSKNKPTRFLIEPGICYRYTTTTVGALTGVRYRYWVHVYNYRSYASLNNELSCLSCRKLNLTGDTNFISSSFLLRGCPSF